MEQRLTDLEPSSLSAEALRALLRQSYRDPESVVRRYEGTRPSGSLESLEWGVALGQMSVLGPAAAVLRDALLSARVEGVPGVELYALAELAKTHGRLGDYAEAQPICEEAIALAQRLGELRFEALVLGTLGMLFGSQDQPEPYALHTRRALAIARELGDDQLTAHYTINLAGALTRLGRLDESSALYDLAESLLHRVDWPEGRALLLAGRGAVAAERGDLARSEQLTAESNEIFRLGGNIHQMARQLLLLGERFLRHGDPAGAARTFAAASELAAVRQIHALEADAKGGLSSALEALGDTTGALAAARASSRAGQAQLRQHHAERTQALVLSHELQTARRDVELANRRAAELERANAALVEAQVAIAESLAEKETLLREIHHRVKNNLQVVSSLLSLQANTLGQGDARDALDTCAARVRSMALIHRRLYDVDSLSHIDLAEYARDLAGALQASLAPGAQICVETQPASVTVALAVPIGLILNELLTNAFKYGLAADGARRFAGYAGSDCDVRLALSRRGDSLVLFVADNGSGASPDRRDSSGVGMHLVEALARQLRGVLTVERDAGTRTTLVLGI